MIAASDDDWRGLLLHRLPVDEAARLECKLLADDGALAALRDAEIDLHDDYARLQLTADEHRAFRRHVLTSPQAEARQRLSQAMKPLPPVMTTGPILASGSGVVMPSARQFAARRSLA